MNPELCMALAPEVEACVHQAGQAILAIYEDETLWGVTNKADDSPLTRADLAAHELLCKALADIGDGWPVLSEESEAIAWETRRQWQTYWLVDPLDGTREFVGRTGEFTVNVALVHGHTPVLGVVGVPLAMSLYVGIQGVGAERVAGQARMPLHVATPRSPLRVLASRRSGVQAVERLLDDLARSGWESRLVHAGSSLKFCRIAEGQADFYPRLAPTSEWDTAAAQCVLEAAGGSVVDMQGHPLRYNTKPDLLNPGFFAWGGRSESWSQWLQARFTRP